MFKNILVGKSDIAGAFTFEGYYPKGLLPDYPAFTSFSQFFNNISAS